MNTWKRRLLALLSVPLLAVPSAAGVYLWLEPHIGWFFAGLTAAGFESLYIGINVLVITTPELRRYARNVALSGVATAVVFNTLARYQAMVCLPAADDAVQFCTLRAVGFDWLALALAVLESVPLAGLAYAVSVLLHRLSEDAARLGGEDARLHVSLAQHEAEIAQLTADLAQSRDRLAQVEATSAQRAADMEQSARGAAHQARELAQALREKEAELAQAREQAAQPLAIDGIDLVRIARTLMDRGVSQREAARLVGMADATLRSRLKASTNGHAVEV
jgi:hypothetical protein